MLERVGFMDGVYAFLLLWSSYGRHGLVFGIRYPAAPYEGKMEVRVVLFT